MFDPYSEVTIGYHLFLEPEGKERQLLQEVISELSDLSGGPTFTPHITVLGRIPDDTESLLVEKTNKVAMQIKKQKVTLEGWSMQDTYYRALYLEVKEREALGEIHASAKSVFGISDPHAYLPHLSLLYGNYSKEEKEHFIQEVQIPSALSFQLSRLHLYKTSGKPHLWVKIYSCSLL